jgi:hypothetical protein
MDDTYTEIRILIGRWSLLNSRFPGFLVARAI